LRREYELTIIASAHLNEEDHRQLIEKYEGIFLADGGEVVLKNDWGVKRLAYSIKGHFKGHYSFYDFIGSSDHLKEAERLMRIDENILRYMVINIGEDADADERKAEIAKAEAAAAAALAAQKQAIDV
tara:strand:+ start:1346 stop:1729 length:384 start_codon:yes stop_codon:yes gene_type:complete